LSFQDKVETKADLNVAQMNDILKDALKYFRKIILNNFKAFCCKMVKIL
jgi:hypothetical protein